MPSFLSFDEILGKFAQEESSIISKGEITKHEEGEPTAFSTQTKKRKERGGQSNSRNPTPTCKGSNIRFRRDFTKVKFYDFHKHGHYAWDCLENRIAPRSNNNNCDNKNMSNNRIIIEDIATNEESNCPPKR